MTRVNLWANKTFKLLLRQHLDFDHFLNVAVYFLEWCLSFCVHEHNVSERETDGHA